MERRQFLANGAAVTTGLTLGAVSNASAWPSNRRFEYSVGSFVVERVRDLDAPSFDVEWIDENRAHVTGTVTGLTGCAGVAFAGIERNDESVVVELVETRDNKVNELCTLAQIELEYSLTIHFAGKDRARSVGRRIRRGGIDVEYTGGLDDPLEEQNVVLRSFTWSPTTENPRGSNVERHDDYQGGDRATVEGIVAGQNRRTGLVVEDLTYAAPEDENEPELELLRGGDARVALGTAYPVDPYTVPGTNLEYSLELIYPNGAPAAVEVDVLAE